MKWLLLIVLALVMWSPSYSAEALNVAFDSCAQAYGL